MKKGLLLKLNILITCMTFIFSFSVKAFAHEELIDTNVDECVSCTSDGDIDETWYITLKEKSDYFKSYHISEDIVTIKYYFELHAHNNSNFTWEYGVRECFGDLSDSEVTQIINTIKTNFSESMKKWNNVCFYSYNSDGTVTKNRIINIVEGTVSDHNISIFPISTSIDSEADYNAATGPDGSYIFRETIGDSQHSHYNYWNMYINISNYYGSTTNYARTGAHEMGHVLGIWDVDTYCNNLDNSYWHHNDIIMGYASPRATNISYKDIAGVAITRGFHTSLDHKWLTDWVLSDNGYKIICSICNGIKYVDNPNEYGALTYGSCNDNHVISSGNMMAVASYEDTDYYKCKFCRYVAHFDLNEEQLYEVGEYVNSSYHMANSLNGLEYSFLQSHIYDGIPQWMNQTQHSINCECGAVALQGHAVSALNLTQCILCGGKVSTGIIQPSTNSGILLKTTNGSYMLYNGVVVLVDEDIQLYINGELEFINPNLESI